MGSLHGFTRTLGVKSHCVHKKNILVRLVRVAEAENFVARHICSVMSLKCLSLTQNSRQLNDLNVPFFLVLVVASRPLPIPQIV